MRSVVNCVICHPTKDMSLGNLYSLRTIANLPSSCTPFTYSLFINDYMGMSNTLKMSLKPKFWTIWVNNLV